MLSFFAPNVAQRACTHKRHHSKGAQLQQNGCEEKGQIYDNNISTAVKRAKVACKMHASAKPQSKKCSPTERVKWAQIYFIFPVTKSLYQRTPCRRRSSARKKEGKQRAERNSDDGRHSFSLFFLLAVMNCASGTNIYTPAALRRII